MAICNVIGIADIPSAVLHTLTYRMSGLKYQCEVYA